MPPLLEARNISKVFGGGLFSRRRTVAVRDISLVISDDRPAVVSVVGESGSGKTTLARMLLGISRPSVGAVLYRGKAIPKMSRGERKVFRREVQAIFQDPFEVYNPFYRVEHVLRTPIDKFGLARSRSQAREMIETAVEAVGLRAVDTIGRYPHQLSGGQRQRIMVARAVLLQPRIILADEPVSMVDASLRATILESLLKLNEEKDISLVYVTHDLTTAYQISETILVLYQGALVEVGDVELVIKDPKHPYTQLLVSSIPQPDPRKRWEASQAPRVRLRDQSGSVSIGCRFADRCPFVMDMCRQTVPPLYGTEARRAVACHLHEGANETDGVELMGAVPRGQMSRRASGQRVKGDKPPPN